MAVSFDGANDYLYVDAAVASSPSFPFAFSGWAMFRTAAEYDGSHNKSVIVTHTANYTFGTQIGVGVAHSNYYSTYLLLCHDFDSGDDISIYQDSGVDIGLCPSTPFHFGIQFVNSSLRQIYCNGVLVGTSTAGNNMPFNQSRISVGAEYAASAGKYFDGQVWDLAIITAALEPRVWWDLAHGRGIATLPEPVAAHWPLEGNNPLGFCRVGNSDSTTPLDLNKRGGNPTAVETPRLFWRPQRRPYLTPAGGSFIALTARNFGAGQARITPSLLIAGSARPAGAGQMRATASLQAAVAGGAAGAGRQHAAARSMLAATAGAMGAAQPRGALRSTVALAAGTRGAGWSRIAPSQLIAIGARAPGAAQTRAALRSTLALAARTLGAGRMGTALRSTLAIAGGTLGAGRSAAAARLQIAIATTIAAAGAMRASVQQAIAIRAVSFAAGAQQVVLGGNAVIYIGAHPMGMGQMQAAPRLTQAARARAQGAAQQVATPQVLMAASARPMGAGRQAAQPRLRIAASAAPTSGGWGGLAARSGIAISAAPRGLARIHGTISLGIAATRLALGAWIGRMTIAGLQIVYGAPSPLKAPPAAPPLLALRYGTLAAPLAAPPLRAPPMPA